MHSAFVSESRVRLKKSYIKSPYFSFAFEPQIKELRRWNKMVLFIQEEFFSQNSHADILFP